MSVPVLENVDDVFPLTDMQQGMLYHTLTDPGSGVFVNQIITPISGELDVARLMAAWDVLVTRHSSLRTAFLWDGLDDPLQVVRTAVRLDWQEHDVSAMPGAERTAHIEKLLHDDRARGFDMADPPLSRMLLIRVGPTQWEWVWSFHHLIADGWSAQVLLDELMDLYVSPSEAPEAALPDPFPYREFVAHYLARDEAGAETFWKEQLAGFRDPHRLGVPGLPPKPDAAGHQSFSIDIDAPATAALTALAREHHVTLNTVALGVWSLILARWMRTADVVFGTTVAGRSSSLEGIERAAGLFINTLPLRVDVAPEQRLGPWLQGIQRDQLDVRAHEQASLASIQRWWGGSPGEPLFESILVFENYPPPTTHERRSPITVGERTHIEQSNYPLAVLVVPGEELRFMFVFDTAALSVPAVEMLGAQVRAVIDAFAEEPNRRLSSISVARNVTDARLHELSAGPTLDAASRPIHELIAAAAAADPGATAIAFEGETVSYAELEKRAEIVADRLVACGVAPSTPVGLYLPRSIEMIVGMVGILKAGGAYVPLDPAYPAEHIRSLLGGDAIDIVLTSSRLVADLPDSISVVEIDGEPTGAAPTTERSRPAVRGSDLAYIIHTSGSTGRPKGVMVTHDNLVHSTMARAVHYRKPPSRFLLLSSFAFDSSVAGIFWTLTRGGTLVLPTPQLEHDVETLLALAAEHQVTHTLCLPTLYHVLLEHADRGQLASLEVAIVAGEACPAGVVAAHRARLPDTELHNEYGPTEATVWCTAHEAGPTDTGEALPIGRPIAGARIHLLDPHGHPVSPGFAGELCVAGHGVTPGYLNRPDLTAERFVTLPIRGVPERIYRTGDLAAFRSDGTLAFLGRTDQQLKIRGHRIEAEAVEAALREHREIREAAVVGAATPGGSGAQLVAYVRLDETEGDLTSITERLRHLLPDFMVPDVLVPLAAIPRLPNGKVDVNALPDPRTAAASASDRFVPPQTESEHVLAEIWADLLGVDAVGVRDDFFALGGDSIVSIRMISRARQAGVHIKPGQITDHPTIEELAAAASVERASGTGYAPVTGPVPLGPIQHWFFESSFAVPSHWNQSNLFEVAHDVDPLALEAALHACVQHHDMLRAGYEVDGAAWRQVVAADTAVLLDVVDDPDADVMASIAAKQASLDLASGPLIRAVLMRRPGDSNGLLFIAVHHLVIDVVSWTVLAEDLQLAYEQLTAGSTVALPDRTTPFGDWVDHLATQDRTGELEFWMQQLPPPRRSEAAVNRWGTEATRRSVTVEFEAEATANLLRSANDAYQTRPEELIVAALTEVLAHDADDTPVHLSLEGHGRTGEDPAADVSRTVGWFTALYPLAFEVDATDEAGRIKRTKETMRAVPDGGIGYGTLRYLHHRPELAGQPEPDHLFNYLGRVASDRTGILTWVSSALESSRHPDNGRPHRFEIVASVQDDLLHVTWHFSESHDEPATVGRLASRHIERLRSLIRHCSSADAGGYTPSDFPEAGLDQEELDRFLEGLA